MEEEMEADDRIWQTCRASKHRAIFLLVASTSQLLPTKKELTTDSWRSARKTRLVSLDLPPELFLARARLSPPDTFGFTGKFIRRPKGTDDNPRYLARFLPKSRHPILIKKKNKNYQRRLILI